MNTKRPVILSTFVALAIAASFLLPKPKYESMEILGKLNLPAEFGGWTSRDISEQIKIQDGEQNFISDMLARVYKDDKGNEVLLIVLDAGNFHNPKVCYGSSGFAIEEMENVDIGTKNTAFKANALYMERQNESMVMLYWLCIDKKIVDWTGQKITEFWSSLFNKKKAGLMVRLDMPAGNRSRQDCVEFGREFLNTLDGSLSAKQREYLFGT